ncbi:MAG TPA: helix-turn-helix domain-containing protein, partial [Planctomycetota bacterium]|nr:helix-turn-helix domain-containing protein [Planctomycetota bacterium]
APSTSASAAAKPAAAAPAPVAVGFKLADIEKEHILRVLAACDNNKKLAAEKLGIDRSTLYAKLRAYGILAQES